MVPNGVMSELKQPGADPEGWIGTIAPLKLAKVSFFTMNL